MTRPATYSGGMYPLIGQPAYPELWRGCVGAWSPCLGPTGLRLFDWSGFANHGTLTNMDVATDWVQNQGRYALDFDASNDYVDLGSWQPLSTGAPFTISAWIYSRPLVAFEYPNIVMFRSNAGRFNVSYSSDASYLGVVFGSDNASWGRFRNGLAASTWSNVWKSVIVTYNGAGATTSGNFKTYVDGLEVAITTAGAFGAQPDRSAIGASGTGVSVMKGLIDSVMLHDRVVSGNVIKCLASRRGIAYEVAPRRVSRIFTGGFKAYWAARKAQIIGGGL